MRRLSAAAPQEVVSDFILLSGLTRKSKVVAV